MSAATILAILVAAGEAKNPATVNLRATIEEALGIGTSIRVLEMAQPSDSQALRVERDLGAGAVVTLLWREPAHLQARLRIHLAKTDRWTTRTIEFALADSLSERGRHLGLAIASMWPETPTVAPSRPRPNEEPPRSPPRLSPNEAPVVPSAAHPKEPAASRSPSEPPVTPRSPPARAASEPPSEGTARPSGSTSTRSSPPTAVPSRGRPADRGLQIGLSAIGAVGIGGPASGLGAGAEAVRRLAGPLSLRAEAGLRTGPFPQLPGSDLVGSLAGGLEWWLLPASKQRPWALGIRGDALCLWHRIRGTVAMGQPETHGRFLPGANLALEATVRVHPRLNLILAVGPEVAFGTTQIRVGSEPVIVATIPAVRAVAQAGFRWGM